MEVFWRPQIANACDGNLSQVADNAALPLPCQAKNLSLAQLFRMLESGARFGERLRQLTRSQRRDSVTIDGQSEKQWRRESILFALKPGQDLRNIMRKFIGAAVALVILVAAYWGWALAGAAQLASAASRGDAAGGMEGVGLE